MEILIEDAVTGKVVLSMTKKKGQGFRTFIDIYGLCPLLVLCKYLEIVNDVSSASALEASNASSLSKVSFGEETIILASYYFHLNII